SPGAHHPDPLHQRRVVLEPEVGPRRRVRVGVARPREAPEELLPGGRVTGRLQRHPVRLLLEVARDRGLQRRRRGRQDDEDEQRERDRLRPPQPAAAPCRPRDRERAGEGKSAYQPIASTRCLRAWWPSSWANTKSISRREKRPSSSVSQTNTFRVGPKPTVNALAALVVPCTSWTRTGIPSTPSCRASRSKSARSSGSCSSCELPTR